MSAVFGIWDAILVNPLLNLLMFFYHTLGSNMGIAIIALSLFVKVIFLPLTNSGGKAMQKQRELMPELEKLKKKYGTDKERLAKEQLKLYQEAGINPASGCITQLIPLLVTFALFGVINNLFGQHALSLEVLNSRLYIDWLRVGDHINSTFLYMDLAQSDRFFILPVLAAAAQFLSSKMMMPKIEKAEKLAKATDDQKDDVMYNMQEQMLYTMPIVFLIVGIKLPSGVVLNIFATALFSLIQQWYINGFKFNSGAKKV